MSKSEQRNLNVNGESFPIDENDESDYVPPPRLAFHTEPKVCESILRSAVSSVPLAIRSSGIGSGSGLFLIGNKQGCGLERGQEIFKSSPIMAAVDYGNDGFCHYCLKDTKADSQPLLKLGGYGNGVQEVKTCTACRVARFCSKECQKAAWGKFHKDECKILRAAPRMRAQHLLVHRLVFWQQRGFITTAQGKTIEMLETHFDEYTKDEALSPEVYDIAVAVRKATGEKVDMSLVWRLVPAVRISPLIFPCYNLKVLVLMMLGCS